MRRKNISQPQKKHLSELLLSDVSLVPGFCKNPGGNQDFPFVPLSGGIRPAGSFYAGPLVSLYGTTGNGLLLFPDDIFGLRVQCNHLLTGEETVNNRSFILDNCLRVQYAERIAPHKPGPGADISLPACIFSLSVCEIFKIGREEE